MFLDQQARDAAAEMVKLRVVPPPVIVDDGQRVARAAFQQFGGSVQPLRVVQFRQVEAEFRKQLRRGQAVANKGVVHLSSSSPRTRGPSEKGKSGFPLSRE